MSYTATKVSSRHIVQYIARTPAEQADLNYRIREARLRVDYSHRDFSAVKPIRHGFSPDAKKRMRNAIDNFALIFKGATQEDRNLLYFKAGDKWHIRKPVCLTLTMPVQTITDKEVKRDLLIPMIQDLVRTYHVINYVWKSEAQERGVVHFHLIIDAYVDHWKIRNLWFKKLKAHGCNGKYDTAYKLSKLVHLSAVDSLDDLADKLGKYFEGSEEENGDLRHKHKLGATVRKVEGRGWGCADNLKYKQLTFMDICPEWQKQIEVNAIDKFEVMLTPLKKAADVFQTQKNYYSKQGYLFKTVKPPMPTDNALLCYHAIHAQTIYGHGYLLDDLLQVFSQQINNFATCQTSHPNTTI